MDDDPATRPRRVRRLLPGVLVAAIVAVVAVVAVLATGNGQDADGQGQAGAARDEPPGEPVPDTQLVDFDGEPVRLRDFDGQPLVVNFFASWCPPCVAEMRDALGPVHEEIGDDVAFLGVALQDTPEAALAVVDDTGVTYDLADDPDGRLFAEFALAGMPATVYVDPDGHVVGRHVGSLTRPQLEDQIDENLSP